MSSAIKSPAMRTVRGQGHIAHEQQSAKDEREDPHVEVPAPEVLLRAADQVLDSKEPIRVGAHPSAVPFLDADSPQRIYRQAGAYP